jgi:hypothetical protein
MTEEGFFNPIGPWTGLAVFLFLRIFQYTAQLGGGSQQLWNYAGRLPVSHMIKATIIVRMRNAT